MKFFLDTADVDAIRELNELGMVDGVTTNPSLILKSGRNIAEVTREICEMVPGPVSAEVVASDAEGMIREGKHLAQIAPNVTVKVPLTWDGLKACKALTDDGHMVNVTLCFSALQALLARQPQLGRGQRVAGRGDDIGDVLQHRVVEVDRAGDPLQLTCVVEADRRLVGLLEDPGVDPPDDLGLVLR